MWDLIVSVPDHCLSFYLVYKFKKILGSADFSDQLKKLSFVTNVLDIT